MEGLYSNFPPSIRLFPSISPTQASIPCTEYIYNLVLHVRTHLCVIQWVPLEEYMIRPDLYGRPVPYIKSHGSDSSSGIPTGPHSLNKHKEIHGQASRFPDLKFLDGGADGAHSIWDYH